MNETLQNIKNRRSTRKFTSQEITQSDLDEIITAGTYAPSGKNKQPWHFTVIKNKDDMEHLNHICKTYLITIKNPVFMDLLNEKNMDNFDLFYNAPVAILVSVENTSHAPMIDGALALGNMLLAAESLGLGSCWIQAPSLLYTSTAGEKVLIKESFIPDIFSEI